MFNYADLFAGSGGLSLGIERAGGELQLAVEKSDMAAYTYYANFIDESIDEAFWRTHASLPVRQQAEAGVVVAPLRDVLDDDEAMNKVVGGKIDVVVGGPPCQGFSLAGKRDSSDIRNRLPWEYLEFVSRTAPKVVVIENVLGMNQRFAAGEETSFVQLQQALRETGGGYVVQGVAVNALHYGAPQNRPRLMIIGLRSDVARERDINSSGTLWKSGFLDEIDLKQMPPLAPKPSVSRALAPTVADAIGDLQVDPPSIDPDRAAAFREATRTRSAWGLPSPSLPRATLANQEPRNHRESTVQRFRIYQWLRANNINSRLLTQLNSPVHSESEAARMQLRTASYPAVAPDGTVLANDWERMNELAGEFATRKHSQRALAWNEAARTVVTLPDDYVHPSVPRIFTVRELARFQGFPDDFEFRGRATTGAHRRKFEVPQYSQVGNAVSPFLARAVGELIARILA